MTMLPLLLTTRAAPTVPPRELDPDIVPTMRSESGAHRTCEVLAARGDQHRPVGLGDEAAAFDTLSSAPGSATIRTLPLLLTIRSRAITNQPKPGPRGLEHRRQGAAVGDGQVLHRASAPRTASERREVRAATITAGSTTMTASNSSPLASAAGTTTNGWSGETSPGSARTTLRASSGAARPTCPSSAITATVAISLASANALGNRVRELVGRESLEVGRVAGLAHRLRRRDVGCGVREQSVGEVEDRTGQPVADRELCVLGVQPAGRGARASRPRSAADAGRWPAQDRRAPSSTGRARRASMRSCMRREVLRFVDDDVAEPAGPPFTNASASSISGRSAAVHASACARRSTSACSSASSIPSARAGEHGLLRAAGCARLPTALTVRQQPSTALRFSGRASSSAPHSLSSVPRSIAACTARTQRAPARRGTAAVASTPAGSVAGCLRADPSRSARTGATGGRGTRG